MVEPTLADLFAKMDALEQRVASLTSEVRRKKGSVARRARTVAERSVAGVTGNDGVTYRATEMDVARMETKLRKAGRR
jgi:hypothetical protein